MNDYTYLKFKGGSNRAVVADRSPLNDDQHPGRVAAKGGVWLAMRNTLTGAGIYTAILLSDSFVCLVSARGQEAAKDLPFEIQNGTTVECRQVWYSEFPDSDNLPFHQDHPWKISFSDGRFSGSLTVSQVFPDSDGGESYRTWTHSFDGVWDGDKGQGKSKYYFEGGNRGSSRVPDGLSTKFWDSGDVSGMVDADGNVTITIAMTNVVKFLIRRPVDGGGGLEPWKDITQERQKTWAQPFKPYQIRLTFSVAGTPPIPMVETNRDKSATTSSPGIPFPGSGGIDSSDEGSTLFDSPPTISPIALTGFASLATAGITALGAGLMMFGMGVSPRDVINGVRELFSGTPPEPPAYVEPSPPPPPIHRDGDVNESGEVWSDEDRGWVGRNLYDQERNRRRDITDQLERERHSGQSEDVKKAYDDWQQSKEKLEAVREEGRMLVKKENLRQWVENRERDLQEQSYWSDVKNNFLLNVDGELTALPHETFEICRETAKAVKSGVDTVSDVVKDATNWEILRATGAQTSRDILGSPLQSAGKVGKFYHDVTAGAGKVAVNIVANPVEIAKVVTGYENWSQALDYHVPLSKRIGHALMGTVDTVTMFGGAVAKEGGAALARGIEAVDTVAEAAKAEKLAMEAGAIARKLSPEDLARHQAWELGEQQARQKVSTLHASKNPGELRDAVLQIQGDKRGLQMLNGEASEVKATFNREIRGIYKETDAAVETRLRESLDRKGVDLDRYDLKPTHATNPSADPFKIGADRDITYSLYDKQSGQWVRDVPADQVQGVYNEEFFKAAHGRPPTGADDVAGFASKMDQQCVDSVHPEAYGRGPADLETALHQPGRAFQDPTAVGKSVSYKAHEWYGKASDAMKNGDPVLAEQHLSEGFRQTTKQFDNLLVARHDALREAGTRGLKEIPERMQEAVDVLKTTHSGVSPVVVERQLAELGYHSPGELATHLGEYVEAMDKLRPGSAATINWRAAYTGARTVMAGYQPGGSLP